MSRTEKSLKSLKQERTKQWANNRKISRGWDRYRASTFLEIVGAKIDRCLQCQDLLSQSRQEATEISGHMIFGYPTKQLRDKDLQKMKEIQERMKKLDFDAHDSLLDAYNYLGKLVELVEKDPEFLTNGRMP